MYHFKVDDPIFLPHCACRVEFSLEKGRALTLVGENGIGKTSLLKRFYSDFPEAVLIDQVPSDLFYDRKLVTVKEIYLSTRVGEIDLELFHELWQSFEFFSKEDRLQSTLSGGESQLLKILLGLSFNSNIYLLDEPSQYLDESMKKKLNEVIIKLLENKKAIFIIEHDLSWQTYTSEKMKLEIHSGVLVRGQHE